MTADRYLCTFAFVLEKGVINLHDDYWASKCKWYIYVEETPAADIGTGTSGLNSSAPPLPPEQHLSLGTGVPTSRQ